MKRIAIYFTMSLAAICAAASEGTSFLWSDKATSYCNNWLEMYPVGNGWMGAMVGGGRNTGIQFNLSRIWSGKPHCYDREGAYDVLDQMRQLVFANKIGEAYSLCDEKFMGNPKSQATYQPCGDLFIDFDSAPSSVTRRLELDKARHVSTLKWGTVVEIQQETFAPYTEKDFIFHRMVSSVPGALSFNLRLRSAHENSTHFASTEAGNVIGFEGQVEEGGVKFAARASVLLTGPNPKCVVQGENFRITGATTVEIRLTAASDMKSWRLLSGKPAVDCAAALGRIAGKTWDSVKAEHESAFGELYGRVKIELPAKSGLASLTTLERLNRQASERDPGFAELIFN